MITLGPLRKQWKKILVSHKQNGTYFTLYIHIPTSFYPSLEVYSQIRQVLGTFYHILKVLQAWHYYLHSCFNSGSSYLHDWRVLQISRHYDRRQSRVWVCNLLLISLSLGGESMSVGQSAIVAKWFKGKELSMALGLNISFSRLGSVINGIVIPEIYNNNNTDKLGLALLVGLGVCIFSFMCAVFLCKISFI